MNRRNGRKSSLSIQITEKKIRICSGEIDMLLEAYYINCNYKYELQRKHHNLKKTIIGRDYILFRQVWAGFRKVPLKSMDLISHDKTYVSRNDSLPCILLRTQPNLMHLKERGELIIINMYCSLVNNNSRSQDVWKRTDIEGKSWDNPTLKKIQRSAGRKV